MNKPWVYFRFGDDVAMMPPAVHELWKLEVERLKQAVGSNKLPPLLNAIIINSVNTPIEGLV